ncbi:MAG: NIPSNAP family protein [Prosthecobacter sp.]
MNRFSFLCLTACSLLSILSTSLSAAESKVYELRIYVTNEGKLDALLARFRDHTCKLFEKHGIENIGYWVPIEKADGADNTLIYIVAHPSRDEAKTNWKAFGADPDWQTARKASEEAGKILAKPPESIFMSNTEYSPPVKIEAGEKERVFEMRTYSTPEGKLDALHARFKNHTINLFSKHGMSHLAYWVPTDAEKGAGTKIIYILSHASQEAGKASFSDFRADPDWVAAKAASEKDGPLTLADPDGVKSIYMRALDFSPIR